MRKIGGYGIIESNNVQDAWRRQKDCLKGNAQVRPRSLVEIPVAPPDFKIVGAGKALVNQPDIIGYINPFNNDTDVPAVTYQIDCFRRLPFVYGTLPIDRSRTPTAKGCYSQCAKEKNSVNHIAHHEEYSMNRPKKQNPETSGYPKLINLRRMSVPSIHTAHYANAPYGLL